MCSFSLISRIGRWKEKSVREFMCILGIVTTRTETLALFELDKARGKALRQKEQKSSSL